MQTPVRSVTVTDRGARVTVANGKVFEADHVLLTAPPRRGTASCSTRCCRSGWLRRWAAT
jgi:protoporphyrinogen oxidase